MTTAMPLSSQPKEEKMPVKRDWKGWVMPGGMLGLSGIGMMSLTDMQSELKHTRETNIRLEERVGTLSEDVKSMKTTIEAIRSRLESKGIVYRLDSVVGEVAGERNTSK